jgi:hypothetical protein
MGFLLVVLALLHLGSGLVLDYKETTLSGNPKE